MKKCCSAKAFTIIELMVSIFITVTIIASFYKLYDASVRTERSASIRVAVNLMGEQMIDTIAESIRLMGLNSVKSDYLESTGADGNVGIIRHAGEYKFVYLSPYGSPITKVKTAESNFPSCKFKLFNTAAFYNGVNKLYFHNEDGFFKTVSVGTPTYLSDGIQVIVTFSENDKYNTIGCEQVFPEGSLVTGEDFVYTLEYTSGGTGSTNSLTLSYAKESSAVGVTDGTLVDFSYNPENNNNYYSMPKFVLEYLVESCTEENETVVCQRNWKTPKSSVLEAEDVKGMIAVRFGFILLSRKERVYSGSDTPGSLPTYCIFKSDNDQDYYCDTLPSLNYTASVFRKVVYLANYRFLKDQTPVE